MLGFTGGDSTLTYVSLGRVMVQPFSLPFSNPRLGRGVPPGIYDVIIDKTGYRQWSRANVLVRSGHCGPMPVHLNAALEPIEE